MLLNLNPKEVFRSEVFINKYWIFLKYLRNRKNHKIYYLIIFIMITINGNNIIPLNTKFINYLFNIKLLKIDKILISGCNKKEFETIISVSKFEGKSFIDSNNLKKILNNAYTLSWIDSLIVIRKLPNVLYIKIKKKIPIAILEDKKKFYLIEDKCGILKETKLEKIDKNLPIITGEESIIYLSQFIYILRKFDFIDKNVKIIAYISKRRWNLVLDPSVEVYLPESEVESKLIQLENFLKTVNFKLNYFNLIDLRLKDRIIIRLKDLSI